MTEVVVSMRIAVQAYVFVRNVVRVNAHAGHVMPNVTPITTNEVVVQRLFEILATCTE